MSDKAELVLTDRAALALLDDAERALASVQEPEDADVLWRKVKAVEEAARLAKLADATVASLTCVRLRAKRRWGELLGEPEYGGKRNQVTSGDLTSADTTARNRARKLAEIPEDAFAAILEMSSPDKPPTEAGLLKLLRQPVEPVEPGPLPAGTFRTVVADPPWRYGNTSTRGAAEDHYGTMTIEELCELPVEDRSAPDAHLYLWTTNNFLREAFDVLDAWGFAYKTCLTWVKPQMGMGNYFRGVTEHVLFGTRGKLAIERRDLVNVINSPRGRHSAKPGAFYELVETASPGPYLEMFARESRLGDWSYWGNESLESAEVAA